jgi:hypothetical protein
MTSPSGIKAQVFSIAVDERVMSISVERQARRMAVGAMLMFAVFGGAIAAATLRKNSEHNPWQGPPTCPVVTAGDAVDAKVQPAADSACRRVHESGNTRIVSTVSFAECSDGRRLYVIDRRDVDGLGADERIVLYGYAGGTFEAGPLPATVTAQCRG